MSTIDSPAIGTATINAVSVDCPAKTNLTLHVGPSHAEWGGRHELDTIYCAVPRLTRIIRISIELFRNG